MLSLNKKETTCLRIFLYYFPEGSFRVDTVDFIKVCLDFCDTRLFSFLVFIYQSIDTNLEIILPDRSLEKKVKKYS